MKARPSQEKRRKELARQDRKKDKAAQRAQRRLQKEQRSKQTAPGEDPDIAGITPGPQPPPPDFDRE